MDRDRQKRDWEMKERQSEEQRRKDEEMMRRQQEEMQMRIMRQEEDLRRRQAENTLFMQAHQLNNMLDKQEQAMLDDDFTPVPDNFGMRGAATFFFLFLFPLFNSLEVVLISILCARSFKGTRKSACGEYSQCRFEHFKTNSLFQL